MPGTGYDAKMSPAAFRISEEDARLAGRRGVTVTTTLSWLAESMESDAAEGQRILDEVIRPNLAVLRKYGVPILIGSDQFRQSSAPEAMFCPKLRLFSNDELLKMWCETTPRAIFPGRRIGRLAEGYEASFLALEADPLVDFSATGNPPAGQAGSRPSHSSIDSVARASVIWEDREPAGVRPALEPPNATADGPDFGAATRRVTNQCVVCKPFGGPRSMRLFPAGACVADHPRHLLY